MIRLKMLRITAILAKIYLSMLRPFGKIFKGVLVISASISIFFFHQNILVQIFYIAVLLLIIIPEAIKAYRKSK